MNKINENMEIKINVEDLELILFPKRVLNSLCNLFKMNIQKIKWRLGINQKERGINKIPIKVLIQFKDKLNKFVEGSKMENKFVIIFN